jgi:glycosyltransferase involved in cell wall biosynthesis
MVSSSNIAVAIPCYKVKKHILQVINSITNDIKKIYIIDDCCPEQSGRYVLSNTSDPRIEVIFHEKNKGVGGAVISAYKKAILDGMDIVIKIDGDGQMDTSLIRHFVKLILSEKADYVKGNRFFDISFLHGMPLIRLFGNTGLSFISKLASGYWQVMDPTNGFTAIHTKMLEHLPLDKIANRYFFESDMLFQLGMLRAVVADIPIHSRYQDEKSNMNIFSVLFAFPFRYLNCILKRLFYQYFVRDFNLGSFCFLIGVFLFCSGVIFGAWQWYTLSSIGLLASSGTVMAAALPIIIGIQFLLSSIQYDILNIPKSVIYPFLTKIDHNE